MSAPELHSSIVALVSLASGIASKHPDMGLCQLDKLRNMGVADEQIASVIEIARHIRDEAARKLDTAFDTAADILQPSAKPAIDSTSSEPRNEAGGGCCASTVSGQRCC